VSEVFAACCHEAVIVVTLKEHISLVIVYIRNSVGNMQELDCDGDQDLGADHDQLAIGL
jgi:hypothetical protein